METGIEPPRPCRRVMMFNQRLGIIDQDFSRQAAEPQECSFHSFEPVHLPLPQRGLDVHPRLSLATDVDVYFCDQQSPWQRARTRTPTVCCRQYFPRGTDLSLYSQAKLSAVARQLNERPRKILEYQTPAECFQACVAATR
jgi:hypothetical protein